MGSLANCYTGPFLFKHRPDPTPQGLVSLDPGKHYGEGSLECPNRDPMLHFGPKVGLGRQGLTRTGLWHRTVRKSSGREHVRVSTRPPPHQITGLGVKCQKKVLERPCLGERQQIPGPLRFLVPGQH